jgi:hypothetical protein
MEKKPLKKLSSKPKRTGWRLVVHNWVVLNVMLAVALLMFLGCTLLFVWLTNPGAF